MTRGAGGKDAVGSGRDVDERHAYFEREPRAWPLYQALEAAITGAFPDAQVVVQRSQIGFRARHPFAAAWLPVRRIAGRPEVYLVLTIYLRRRIEEPRIVEAVEPYPGRWTHHLLIARTGDVDAQVMAWLREAYERVNV